MTPLWLMGALAGFTFVSCYVRSLLLPHTPLLLWGDALGYATKGVRILEGQVPYRDFFDFVTPGTELLYAFLFRSIGVRLWVPNLLMCVLASLTALWLTWSAGKLLPRRFVLLAVVLLTGYVLAGSFDATHHWFSTLGILAATAMLWDGISSGRILAAGALCGAAASFTQTKGAAALLALLAYIWWKSHHESDPANSFHFRILQLCISAFIVFTAVNLPFLLAARSAPMVRGSDRLPLAILRQRFRK
jgi:hypothetical protein